MEKSLKVENSENERIRMLFSMERTEAIEMLLITQTPREKNRHGKEMNANANVGSAEISYHF